jgi:class 3 adenylate cyclase
LRGVTLARWSGHVLGWIAALGFLAAQGYGFSAALGVLAFPVGGLLVLEVVFSFVDPRVRRLGKLAPSAFPFKNLQTADRDFLQGFFLKLPTRARHRASLAWLVSGLAFFYPPDQVPGDLEPVAAWLGLGMTFSIVWQSLRAAVLRRRVLPYFYFEKGASVELARGWMPLHKTMSFRFLQLAFFAGVLPILLMGVGYPMTLMGTLWYLLCALVLALAMGSMSKELFSAPLIDLDLAVSRFASGDYDALVDISSGDEIGSLQSSWNQALPVASARQARLENVGGLFAEARAPQLMAGAVRMDPHPVQACVVRATFEGPDDLENSLGLANRFLEAVVEAADKAGGATDIRGAREAWVLFNAPLSQEDAAQKALECAWALQQALKVWSSIQRIQAGLVCKTQVRAHRGSAMAGRLGPRGRGVYGLAGPLVRELEAMTGGDSLLVSRALREALANEEAYSFSALQEGLFEVTQGPDLEPTEPQASSALPFTPGERL